MGIDQDFWRGRKVLITGHTGFKGSWLTLWLSSLGADVGGFSLKPNTDPNAFELLNLSERCRTTLADIRDYEAVTRAIAEYEPEIVFHMAAQPLVRLGYRDPRETYSTNVMGTVNLLQSVAEARRPMVILVVTSDKCYENKEWAWGYRESEPMGGYDPYSSSKGCAELVTAAFRRSFFHPERWREHGVALASARAGNVIGGGDWSEDRLVPDIVRSYLAKTPLKIRYPDAIRPWQLVLEPLSGYIELAQKMHASGDRFSDSWNFGPLPNQEASVRELIDKIRDCWLADLEIEIEETPVAHEAHFLKLDCSKAAALLGWRPKLMLAKAVEQTVSWYKSYAQRDRDLTELSLAQIADYTAGS